MGLLPLTRFDDPPQLSLQVVLPGLKRIMCLRLSRTQGLSHTHTHTHTQCLSDTGWVVGGSIRQPSRGRRLLGNKNVIVI